MQKLRWGLIGAGDIVKKRVAPALTDSEGCELKAIARANPDLAASFAEEFGIERWYKDWRELVVDPEIDAVYIATPVFLHAEQTIAAAKAGKHVLCEKPMAMDAGECRRMIDVSAANGVKLGIAYYRRFYPVLARVRELITNGEIGRAVIAQINAFEYVDMPPNDPRGWFLQKAKSGGGPMMDFGCHRIEVLTDLFGGVSRMTSLATNTLFDHEVEDTANVFMEFDSGVVGSVTVTHAACEPQDTLDIYGNNGSIHISKLNSGEMTIKTAEGTRIENHPPPLNFHQPLIEDFTKAVLSDREPRVNGQTGLTVAEIVDKIYDR